MKFRAFIAVCASVAMLASCHNSEKEYVHINGFAQGSTYSMIYRSADKRSYQPQIDSLLKRFDESLSIYSKTSIISRMNRNDSTAIADRYFEECFKYSYEIYKASDGAFDITVGPLANMWGFGSNKQHSDVTPSMVDSVMALVGMDKIQLKDGRLVKADTNMVINTNAIAQGYSVDVISAYFDSLGITDYMVEIGGEVYCKGLNPKGKEWTIGIDKPYDGNITPGESLQARVALPSGKALVTSGNYRKFYVENGVKYSHELDPKTGYPAKNTLLSVSVVAKNATYADGFATAFMVMGLDATKAYLSKHTDMDAYLVYSGPKGEYLTYATPGFEKLLLPEK